MPYRHQVQPRLKFIPPRYTPWVMRLSYAALPVLLQLRLRRWLPTGIWPVTCENPDRLLDCFEQFQTGKIRLILAFRHSQVDDPLSLAYLFAHILPRRARQQGRSQFPIHSHFMYDRGMPLWAGSWLGWLFSRLGGIPIHRGRQLDLHALKTVRHYLVQGQFPMTIAPEGATNGHGEVVSPLEPGTAKLAFWAVDDLHKAGRSERVLLLPVGLRYFYPHPDWAALNRLLTQLEADVGLPCQSFPPPEGAAPEAYYQRLLRLGQHLLTRMEDFYRRFYHYPLTDLPDTLDSPTDMAQHLQRVLATALTVGEQFFDLPGNGSLITRCRRLEEAGWSYIYREDLGERRHLPPLEQGLADWAAEAAGLHMRHMRLVESFVAVSGHYVQEKPTFERFAETTLILFDLVERLKGVQTPCRPRLGRRQAVIRPGQPIDVTQRWPDYAASRRQAQQAVTTLTTDLQQAMEALL